MDRTHVINTSPKTENHRPKLLFVVSEDWYFVSHRLPLARAARRAGFDVSVATRISRKQEAIARAGVKVHPLAFNRSGMAPAEELRTLWQLVRLYAREKPDIVHHVALKPVLYGALAARLTHVPCVVHALGGLGYVFRSEGGHAASLRRIARPLLRAALGANKAQLIIQVEDDRKRLVEDGLIDADRVHLIPGSGVEPERYRLVDHNTDVPLVILPARLLRDKGVVEFAEAARKLRREGVAARFALVGRRDPANPACISSAALDGWRREGVVELWGWREDMPDVFAQAQIVCLPSYHEGVPKALLEAAASGCAIVASDIPGCRSLVRAGETGWLVPPRDVKALAIALRAAITQAGLRQRLGQAARARIAGHFSMDHITGQTLALYRSLLDARPARKG